MPKRKTTTVNPTGTTTGKRSASDGARLERNWSALPQDILHLFSKKLPDISDFIRFRAVCKSWQQSAPVTDPPPQLPWLLERREDPESDQENAIIRFYCLSSRKVHTIFCPRSCRAWLEGPACRYLIASHSRSFERYLLNPLTHDMIYAPRVKLIGWPDYIGPDSIEGGDVVAVSGYADCFHPFPNMGWNTRMMAFWRPEAEDWIHVAGVGASGNAFYMGQYFSNDNETGIMSVIDIATKKMAYQVEPPKGTNPLLKGCTIFVESGGKILRLFQYYEDEQCHFDIHCLYFGDGEGKPCWVKINDIGDQMLFLHYYSGLSFSASNFAGFEGNYIYFLEKGRELCRYDIGDDITDVLPVPFDSLETWFVPRLVLLSDINNSLRAKYSSVKARFEVCFHVVRYEIT